MFSAMPRSIAELCVLIREGVGLMGLFVVKVFWSMNLLNSLFRAKSVGKNDRVWLYAFLISLLATFGAPSQAIAQDWVFNINDDGFQNLPAGSTIEYDVTVTNSSFAPSISPVTFLEFTVPPNTTFTGFTPSLDLAIDNCVPRPGAPPAAGIAAGVVVRCDIPEIPGVFDDPVTMEEVETFAQVTLNFKSEQSGDVNFDPVVLDLGNVDGDDTNNSDPISTPVQAGSDIELDLSIPNLVPPTIPGGLPTAAAGSFVDFVVETTNNGPDPSDGYDVVFTIPTGIANVATPTGSGFTCTRSVNTFTCAVAGIVAPGDANGVDITFTGQVIPTADSTISAGASVINNFPLDPIGENNLDDESFAV